VKAFAPLNSSSLGSDQKLRFHHEGSVHGSVPCGREHHGSLSKDFWQKLHRQMGEQLYGSEYPSLTPPIRAKTHGAEVVLPMVPSITLGHLSKMLLVLRVGILRDSSISQHRRRKQ
jgi:hypothetical protein